MDPELFFPPEHAGSMVRQAKRICSDCPVKAPCLADGLAQPPGSDHGIYGGTTRAERAYIRRSTAHDRRDRPSVFTDPAVAADAFELARRIGTGQAAQRLGLGVDRLYKAWSQWHLGRPNQQGRELPGLALDPLSAQRAFRLAEQVGLEQAAERLAVDPNALVRAWDRWRLGRPANRTARPAADRLPPAAGGRTRSHPLTQTTRTVAAEPARQGIERARSAHEEIER